MSTDLNLDSKVFKALSNSDNGQVAESTRFLYRQEGEVVWADYHGGEIVRGHLIASRSGNRLHMRYHHLDRKGRLRVGTCESLISQRKDGLLQLDEKWQWLSDDQSEGESVLIELR